MMSRHATPTRFLCVLVLVAAFWLRVNQLHTLPPGLHFDEAENLQRSWRIIQGYGLLPHFEGIPEPLDAAARAGFLALVGVTPFTGRLFAVFLDLLGVAACFALARALYWRQPLREIIALTAALTLAALPPFVVIGRAIYAANWIPVTSLLALVALLWAWRCGRRRYFVMTGLFTALTMMFYLAGLAFPVVSGAALLLLAAARRWRWPSRSALLLLTASGGLTLIPWLLIFIWSPGWLTARIEALAIPNFNPLADIPTLLTQMQKAVQPIFIPDTVFFPVYNPYTTAFLNPPQVALGLIGLLLSLRRWRQPGALLPLVLIVVMIAPNILSNVPEQPIRMVGVYGGLALLVGLGAGALLTWAGRWRSLKQAAAGALAALLAATPLHTHWHVIYHFTAQPRLLDDPTSVYGWAYLLHLGYEDFLKGIIASPQPVYVPVEQVNTNTAVALLRPRAFPSALAYDGRPLPDGELYYPTQSITYGFPETFYPPRQYALLLPASGEILILPPLSSEAAARLDARLAAADDQVTTQGWPIGKRLAIRAADHPFAAVAEPAAPDVPLAVFDGRLELLSLEAPAALTPGQTLPVTLRWRLREATPHDLFIRLQVWDYLNTSRGTQNDRDGLIHRYLYPTVMWPPGQIISEVRWLEVFPDAPPGGYRFAVGAAAYPGPTAFTPQTAAAQDSWALVSPTAVEPERFTGFEQPPVQTGHIVFEDNIRLLGADFTPPLADLKANEALALRLYWQIETPVSDSLTLFLHLKDASGALLAQQDSIPFDRQFPTWAWPPGQVITTSHTLDVPDAVVSGYSLSVGWYRWPSLERLKVTQDGAALADDFVTFRASSR